MSKTPPVQDWTTDYDIFDEGYVKDPVPVWRDLRGKCPIAHTERWGGSWLPTRYEDMQTFVKMVPELSSRDPIVVPQLAVDPELDEYGAKSPPITSDPPEQIPHRRLILPFFTPKAVAEHRAFTEDLCHRLIDGLIDKGECDAATDYAQHIPSHVIVHMLGIDPNRAEEFVQWVRNVLEIGLTDPDTRLKYRRVIRNFFGEMVAERRRNPGEEDLISQLLAKDLDGVPLTDVQVVSMCNLLLVAGIDTTWSSIGASLWHFAAHPEHRRRLGDEPELFPSAIEEMLRFYAPVTMARVAKQEIKAGDVTFKPGDRILMNFPGANHDPEMFDDPDQVILDRERNRHIAFGVGIHRCAGSNLARMEMDVALRVWFARIPEFELSDPDGVTWAGGQVRGPRNLPIRFPT